MASGLEISPEIATDSTSEERRDGTLAKERDEGGTTDGTRVRAGLEPSGRRGVSRWHDVQVGAVYLAAVYAQLLLQHYVSAVNARGDEWAWWPLDGHLGGWVQFDGHDYLQIATNGYSYDPSLPSNVVWFPGYPIAIRAMNLLVDNWTTAAVVVSIVAGLVAVVLLHRWLGLVSRTRREQLAGLAVLMASPYAWYLYGVVYSDALALAATVGAVLAAWRGRYLLAGLAGAIATATRPTAVVLPLVVFLVALEREGVLRLPGTAPAGRIAARAHLLGVPTAFDRRAWSSRCLLTLLSVIGVVAFSAYQWHRFGTPTAWLSNQAQYRPVRLPPLKIGFFAALRDAGRDPTYAATNLAQGLLCVGALLATPNVCRRYGFAMGVLVGGIALIPFATTPDFMGAGRYLLLAFPLPALIGESLALGPRRRFAWVALSAGAMLLLAMSFSRSAYLA